jgi:hypothetical protein
VITICIFATPRSWRFVVERDGKRIAAEPGLLRRALSVEHAERFVRLKAQAWAISNDAADAEIIVVRTDGEAAA